MDDKQLAERCAKGEADALAQFEAKVMPEVRRAVAKVDASEAFVDEAAQAVRERLLAPLDGKQPRIRQYTGEGPLVAWAKVAATRVALNLRRTKGPKADDTLEKVSAPMTGASPELQLMREALGEKLELALADALAALPLEDRNLLRLHYAEGMSLEALGKARGAHKSTLSRRLAKLQEELISGTREALKRRFGIRARELASAIKVFSTRVEVDVKKLLQG